MTVQHASSKASRFRPMYTNTDVTGGLTGDKLAQLLR